LTIVASTLSGNSAALGGGLAHYGDLLEPGGLVITNSTLSGNSAQLGGGLFSLDSITVPSAIHHSTVAKNAASRAGGGLFIAAGNFIVDQSIVATNQSGFAPDLSGFLGAGLSVRYSLVGNRSNSGLAEAPIGMPDANGNLVGGPVNGLLDPKLGPLADNGGPTFTHALLIGSPALDAGDPAAIPPMSAPFYDQRGAPFLRVFDGAGGGGPRIDIGAFERPPSSPAAFGDYNRSGLADAADYVLWRMSLGQSGAPYEGADGDGSGIIDEGDYQVWRAHFGLAPGPLAPQDNSPPPVPPSPTVTSAHAALLSDDAAAVEIPTRLVIEVPSASTAHRARLRPPNAARLDTMQPAAQLESRDLALIAQRSRGESEIGAAGASTVTDVAAHDSVFDAWENESVSDLGPDDTRPSDRLSKDQ
jgi:hypothetical protein